MQRISDVLRNIVGSRPTGQTPAAVTPAAVPQYLPPEIDQW